MGWRELVEEPYRRRLRARVAKGPLPRHVAMIMDGNRRWAREAGLADVSEGHRRGFGHVTEVLSWCAGTGIEHVTLFWVSADNLAKRDPEEAARLMRVIEEVTPALAAGRDWRIDLAGRVDLMPAPTAEVLKAAREDTADAGPRRLTLAVGYDGREDITDAVRALLDDEIGTGRSLRDIAEDLTPDRISAYLSTHEVGDPDLVIRTSGEQRLSGFLLWQSARAELRFIDVKWPSFREIDLLRALRTYASAVPGVTTPFS
ncbi:polyprenyl diphosphate synthase [Amycolatopsis sp. CA-230715]|uniref:polyprenyl diphosphate synthase n=1 Tax=Amycolatopsis sp. CA-230715 TaxID=2745196 RepID=UPI001C033ECF|nr:polyprenyl diphosphate synthase [Amycolatopsis sp. CA-230715]QWF81201.1 (2Z,6E)-farnesyl diphosphate synthase [Amycolatopsis sp. CA-230715]